MGIFTLFFFLNQSNEIIRSYSSGLETILLKYNKFEKETNEIAAL